MSFVRPEVRAGLWRWREVIAGGVVVGFGAVVATGRVGFVGALGWVMIVVGVAAIYAGVRRARFPQGGGGSGVVEVDERRITYLSATGGGAVSINDLVRVQIRTTDQGPVVDDMFWEFTDGEGRTLVVPSEAENAGALFDALTPLDGVDWDAVTRASGSTGNDLFIVWQKPVGRLH